MSDSPALAALRIFKVHSLQKGPMASIKYCYNIRCVCYTICLCDSLERSSRSGWWVNWSYEFAVNLAKCAVGMKKNTMPRLEKAFRLKKCNLAKNIKNVNSAQAGQRFKRGQTQTPNETKTLLKNDVSILRRTFNNYLFVFAIVTLGTAENLFAAARRFAAFRMAKRKFFWLAKLSICSLVSVGAVFGGGLAGGFSKDSHHVGGIMKTGLRGYLLQRHCRGLQQRFHPFYAYSLDFLIDRMA